MSGYDDNMQAILLKDQFIFGVTVHEIQEHLLNEISDDHNLNQCLVEARKIESCIAQRKLLGLKSVDVVNHGRPKKKSKNSDSRKNSRSQSELGSASIVGITTSADSAQLMAKIVKFVERKIILPRSVNLEARAKVNLVISDCSNIDKSITKLPAMMDSK